ncbi:MAG: filamentous hemagglutinin N-terminal domain-containing protein, partial [Pseudomonadota bacterium]
MRSAYDYTGYQPTRRVGVMKTSTAVGGALAAFAFASVYAPDAAAGPKGGQVKGGQAQITTQGQRTTIRQNSDRVVIDWKSFDIDADEAVEFLQPGRTSVALNRVLDGLPTNIRGQLLANGNVWIVNQHGIVFHAGSVVDVGGLLATTSDISNADFMAGNYRFDKPGRPDAKIINEGSITFGQAGLAAFVAPGVENRGVIAGKMGKVVIAGAETFAVDLAGDGMWAFTMGEGAKGASAKNAGRIHNPGGYIMISAASAAGMVDSQISVGGIVEATTAEVKGGKIVLSGDGHVEVSGKLDATGSEAGQIGGGVEVTGETVHLTATAEIDVSGAAGGGLVKIGGDYQGGGDLKTAS